MQTEYISLPSQAADITGQRFGKLVALGPIEIGKSGMVWLCQCDCGQTTRTRLSYLRSGHTQTCGCLRSNSPKLIQPIHGLSHTRTHRVWSHIIDRCTNPKNKSYHRYGGRGIQICKQWLSSFLEFHYYIIALPDYETPGYTLDRINNDGSYEPGNVRWADKKTQAQNRGGQFARSKR